MSAILTPPLATPVTVPNGGTGLASGTSGGILYFGSTTSLASSSLLTANAIVIGGGAGAPPTTITTGTGVLTALGINVGSAGAFVTFNGAGGTPSSLVGTNITGTAAGLTAGVASAVAASGITGTTLASNVVTSSLTTFGILAGNLLFTDNTYDIGASGATRPRNLYLSAGIVAATSVTCGSLVTTGTGGVTAGGHVTTGAADGYGISVGNAAWIIRSTTDVIRLWNSTFNGAPRVNFGGDTTSFPALKRSGTIIQSRLADDSAFASLQGKLTTDTNATTGLTAGVLSALTNADIVLYDASGQAYRVPCII